MNSQYDDILKNGSRSTRDSHYHDLLPSKLIFTSDEITLQKNFAKICVVLLSHHLSAVPDRRERKLGANDVSQICFGTHNSISKPLKAM